MKRSILLIPAAAALALVPASVAWAQTPWLHVRVDEPKKETKVHVNLPLTVVETALAAAPEKIISNGKIHIHEGKHDLSIADMRMVWLQLKDAGHIQTERDLAAVGFKTIMARGVNGCVRLDEGVVKAMEAFSGIAGVPVREAALRTPEGFRACLDRHLSMRELLEDAKAIDFGSLAQIAYGTKRFFDPRRLAVIGEAATAADPLYSPGSDFIALENDFVTELVAREQNGAPETDLARTADVFDRFMAFRHESVMRLYRGLYGMLGSYELMRLKWDFDIGSYHNLWVAAYMTDQLVDPRFLVRQLRQQRFVLGVLDNFRGLFQRAERVLNERGAYHRRNRGVFSWGLENIDFLPEIGLPRSREATLARGQPK